MDTALWEQIPRVSTGSEGTSAKPGIRLRDFSRHPLPVEAQVTLSIENTGKIDAVFYTRACAEPSCLLGWEINGSVFGTTTYSYSNEFGIVS